MRYRSPLLFQFILWFPGNAVSNERAWYLNFSLLLAIHTSRLEQSASYISIFVCVCSLLRSFNRYELIPWPTSLCFTESSSVICLVLQSFQKISFLNLSIHITVNNSVTPNFNVFNVFCVPIVQLSLLQSNPHICFNILLVIIMTTQFDIISFSVSSTIYSAIFILPSCTSVFSCFLSLCTDDLPFVSTVN